MPCHETTAARTETIIDPDLTEAAIRAARAVAQDAIRDGQQDLTAPADADALSSALRAALAALAMLDLILARGEDCGQPRPYVTATYRPRA